MKVIEKLKSEKIVSIEIIPPKRGEDVENIFSTLDRLMKYNISFINITRHPVEIDFIETDSGIVKIQKVKRPGTIGLTAALMKRYNVDVVPHIICKGISKFELEDTLIDLSIMGVENVFVIRGEEVNSNQSISDYRYASELVKQIAKMKDGEYLYTKAKPVDFCVGVAGYPEKHYEAPNLEQDLKFLKEKVDAGADFVITQMVFDADVYKSFVDKCREIGVNVPIIPGVKPIVNKKSIYAIPKKFFVSIPQQFVERMENCKTSKEEFDAGVHFTAELIEKLLEYGAPGVHIFTMGRGEEACEVLKNVENFK